MWRWDGGWVLLALKQEIVMAEFISKKVYYVSKTIIVTDGGFEH